MKKQKSSIINISEFSSSDDEYQAKPKIDKEDLKRASQPISNISRQGLKIRFLSYPIDC